MARRKAKPRRSRKFTGINVLNVTEAFVQANWVTQGFLNTDPLAALIGKTSQGYGFLGGVSNTSGKKRIAISELLGFGGESAEANIGYVWDNVKDNWAPVLLKTVITTGAFKVGKKLFRKPRAQANKLLRMGGVGDIVRV